MQYSIRRGDFASLEGEWQRLLAAGIVNEPFLLPEWLENWWKHWRGSDRLLLMGLEQDGALQAIAPLRRHGDSILLLGDREVCDYLDLIVPAGQEDAFCQHLLDYLDGLDWRTLDFQPLLPTSPILTSLAPRAAERGHKISVEQIDVSPGMTLPSDWDIYLDALDKKDRHELRRKLRRLYLEKNVHYNVIKAEANVNEVMPDFFSLFRLSRPEKNNFLTPEMADYFTDMAARMAGLGHLRLLFLNIGEKQVAAALCFDYGDTFYLYNSGYDPAYAHLSVGLLSKALCVREAIAQGRKRFDFLRGAEPYKYALGGTDVPVQRCLIQRAG